MRRFTFLCCLLFSLGNLSPASAAEREFRGAWVATVYNLDWPSKPGLPAATQKAQLRALLDRAAALKLNAILLQVRPASDALYASKKEPWSKFLSGQAGVSPGYDPLAFAIAEAHARGIELHAWVNPFRAAVSASEKLPPNHVAKNAPGMGPAFRQATLGRSGRTGGARIMSSSVITDIVRRYDIDGVHIDDYFYPYPLKPGDASFPDDASWQRHRREKRDEPRRLAAGQYQRLRPVALSRGQGEQAAGAGRDQPVWHLAPGRAADDRGAARFLRPAFCRLAEMARGGLVRLSRAAALLGHLAGEAELSRSCSIGGGRKAAANRSGPGLRRSASARSGRRARSSNRSRSPAAALHRPGTFTGA